MKLKSIYELKGWRYHEALKILYDLLAQRPLEHGISHKEMPDWRAHCKFVASRPFRYWLLIRHRQQWIGAIECLPTNEFGIALLEQWQGKRLGQRAVKLFMEIYEPLPAIPAVRNGDWLANVAPENERAAAFFEGMGFRKIQSTYAWPG